MDWDEFRRPVGRKGGFGPPLLFAAVRTLLAVVPQAATAQDRTQAPAAGGGVYRRPLGQDPATP